jgi:uncharacterized cupin superfamily protein
MTTTSTITLGTDTPTHLEPFHGFEQVLDGDPAAGVAWLRTSGTADATLYAGIFTVQPSRFRYAFDHDECIHVLAGEVEIAVDGDATVELRPGDLASFGAGTRSTWTVRRPLRKFFVISG